MRREFFALFAAAALLLGMSACTTVDNPSSGGGNAQEDPVVAPAQLKQGVWTEYDSLLVASGKYTAEELAEMPTVGMWIQGDKGYFFTYTAEDMSETVEGQISYNNNTGKGTITFPAIQDSPLSGQSVSFRMTTDETMEFEFTYEGKKTTGNCAWLCENLDNWTSDITDEDWKELMAEYEKIAATAGPDTNIDWSKSEEVEVTDDEGNPVKVEVKDLDKPLVWNDEVAAARGATRAIAIGTIIKTGLNILGGLFEKDPNEETQAKLDAVIGKLDQVLANQQKMIIKLDEINNRLIAIAEKMNQQETVNIFNNRNEKFYNKLKVQNNKYFADAYAAYHKDKNDPDLADYAKAWVGKDEQFANLTWEYIEYLMTVQHTKYGVGMDKIYDGLTYDKYPWEHLGTGDRQNYRAYDLTMITKCLFMISLYSQYGGLNNIEKKGLYKSYGNYKAKLNEFSKFSVTNPDEFRVCQIPGAHFVMRKEIQKYNYLKNNEAPVPSVYGYEGIYLPRWHEAGSPKIENPDELKSKLIRQSEMSAVKNYYNPRNENIKWMKMLVDGDNTAGAVYAKAPTSSSPNLVLYHHTDRVHNGARVTQHNDQDALIMFSLMVSEVPGIEWTGIGFVSGSRWSRVDPSTEFYLAIVEKHF